MKMVRSGRHRSSSSESVDSTDYVPKKKHKRQRDRSKSSSDSDNEHDDEYFHGKRKHSRSTSSSGSDSDDYVPKKKHKHHKHKSSRHITEKQKKVHSKHKHIDWSPSPPRRTIKPDPDADRHSQSRMQPDPSDRLKGSRHHRDGDHRGHRARHQPIKQEYQEPVHRVKQEPVSDDERRQQQADRRQNDHRRREHRRRREQLPEDQNNWGHEARDESGTSQSQETDAQQKEGPNFELSGKLTEDTNSYKGVVIKYNEPPEARKPKRRWRLYPFKSDETLKPFHMHRQSAFLFGRDRKIADIPVDHPSCSKQHAVFQYRMVEYDKDGRTARRIAPYIIDLESANGTFLNNNKIEPRRYFEIMEKDVLKFGFSSREYVLLHAKSDTAEVEESD